ncbi:cupin domain-containing protein [Belnapia sp. F-4-1]|uniref:cupin domain-containing protein n=1 Tax=Belnapia sp. F-4-1 TaxID=1545443 RepID=UPI0019170A43|nr:cupin domain-containing protein [Belnapia sp. F-4-1]
MSAAPRFGRIGEGLVAPAEGGERFETLLAAGGGRVERIVSLGQSDPPGFWYEQEGEEFVLLLAGAARLGFADGTEQALAPGEWAVLPAGCRHRVAWTDPERETLWLALHLPPD